MGKHRRDSKGEYSRGDKPALKKSSSNQAKEETFVKCNVLLDLQSKFVAKENEVQSLHSKLTDTLVSKQQLEQRLMQLMESEQKRVNKEESLQMQVQVSNFPSLKNNKDGQWLDVSCVGERG